MLPRGVAGGQAPLLVFFFSFFFLRVCVFCFRVASDLNGAGCNQITTS